MALMLIELNELNFDIVKRYLDKGFNMTNLAKIATQSVCSSSENKYELLEPWIQWPSVHTGKTFDEHKIFRLGDAVNYQGTQIFENIQKRGYTVGNVSAMNAVNNMESSAFFIPDPWTKTEPDKSLISKMLTQAISQAVNDNAGGKISFSSMLKLAATSLFLVPPRRYFWFIKKLFWAIQKPWRRAIFFDLILLEFFLGLERRTKPDFSCLFLNAGAHIQHHYMLSSSVIADKKFQNPSWYVEEGADPLLEVYQQYDEILRCLMHLPESRIIVATGLSQKPFENPVFDYRLDNHASFLEGLGIGFDSVEPRMTRDFLIRFATDEDRNSAAEKLGSIEIRGVQLFGHIDKRPSELFVTMDYPYEIKPSTVLDAHPILGDCFFISQHINFVAIKNGEHQSKGFVYIDNRIEGAKFNDGDHVARLYETIMSQFPDRNSAKSAE